MASSSNENNKVAILPNECYIDDFVEIYPGEFYEQRLKYLQKILSNRKGSGMFELMITEKYKDYFPNHILRRFRYSIISTGPLRYCFLCLLFFYTLACEQEFQLYIEAQLIVSKNYSKRLFYRTKFLDVLFIETEKLMASAFNEDNALLLVSGYNSHLTMIWKMQHNSALLCDTVIAYNQLENLKNEQDQESKKRQTTATTTPKKPRKRQTRRSTKRIRKN